MKGLQIIFTFITAAAISFFVSAVTVDYRGDERNYQTDVVSVNDVEKPLSKTEVAKSVMPSVVGITTVLSEREKTMGSGFVINAKGYIMTNNHVIANGRKITVTLENGKNLVAQKIWNDSRLDLAVIRVASTLQEAKIGDSSKCEVGEEVIAVGNPLSMQFQHTVTSGIISAKDRSVEMTNYYMENLLQTDASINPGNSGGPLVNQDGEVIGINTVKVSSAEGMGFAIPVNICKPIILSIEETGSFKTPYLGVYAYDKATAMKVFGEFSEDGGIYVAEVDSQSPAGLAGIKEGDIITEVNTEKINSMLELREKLFYHKPGDTVNISLLRNSKKISVSVKLLNKDS